MKRFIDHTELARDRRFVRSNNQGGLMRNLPDDVDAVVEMLEQMAPALAERVKGTPFEEAYRLMGPGFIFQQFTPSEPGQPDSSFRMKLRLHGILVGELQALEGAARTLWDFPDAPWEFKLNMARQCWDEARHVQIYEKLLEKEGGEVGMFPESTFLFETCCADDPALRVAGVNRGLEGLACDAFRSLIDYARKDEDPVTEQAVDYVLADELTHVRFGSDWVKALTQNDPELAKRARDFQREVDQRFSFGGSRSNREDASLRIAWEERKEAGFTEEELEELAALSGEGPKRSTLLEASEIVRLRLETGKQAASAAGGVVAPEPA